MARIEKGTPGRVGQEHQLGYLLGLRIFNAEHPPTPNKANTWGLTMEHQVELGVHGAHKRSLEDVMAELESINSDSQG